MADIVPMQFSKPQIEIMKRTVAAGISSEDFYLFLEVCKARNLNPFNREIYAISRYDAQANGNKMTIQVSIDGFRLLAERSGKYRGQVGPEYCGTDGQWKSEWLADEPPAAARVGVLRSDFAGPMWAVARYKSYVQTKKDGSPTAMWAKMPEVLLAKCAEALALRKTFPAALAGLYTHEEMQQADSQERPLPGPVVSTEPVRENVETVEVSSEPEETKTVDAEPQATPAQIASIRKLFQHLGKDEPPEDLTFNEAKVLIASLSKEYRERKSKPAQPVPQEQDGYVPIDQMNQELAQKAEVHA